MLFLGPQCVQAAQHVDILNLLSQLLLDLEMFTRLATVVMVATGLLTESTTHLTRVPVGAALEH